MAFKPKKKEEPKGIVKPLDTSDFAKLIHKLGASDFALEMHKRLVDDTHLVKNERSVFDLGDVNKVLNNYPGLYAWAIVEYELIASECQRIKDEYEEWHASTYNHVQSNMTMPKPTVKAIECEMNEKFAEAIAEKKKRLREVNLKMNVAKGMTKVWEKAVSSLQTLSANMRTEFKMLEQNLAE